ncbi:ATP-dependent RNA helicase [Plasmodium gonderi]|uniref:RNA helicase n=1 Tax=Plasmodium gonderi TaxID=77519 RepID=A0A1Y1JQZ6_PLAGO|nr:ATP-dependent RNA helicase [Plasmodium gonderi]GAW83647.1 ATP-dependent RNA helicase [Plasmodium gonderi]
MKCIMGIKCMSRGGSGNVLAVPKKFLFVKAGSTYKFASGQTSQNKKDEQVIKTKRPININTTNRSIFTDTNLKTNPVREEKNNNEKTIRTNEYTSVDIDGEDNFKNEQFDNEMSHRDNLNEDLENYNEFDRYEGRGKDVRENGFMNYKQGEGRFKNYERRKNKPSDMNNGRDEMDERYSYRHDNMKEGEEYSRERRTYSRNLNSSDRYAQLGENLKDIKWNNVDAKIERQDLLLDENKRRQNISPEQLEAELKKLNIYVNKESVLLNNFINNFADANFHEAILNHLNAKFKEPTPIQKVTWPIALAGKDLIGVSETGSGKTLAFALPCLMHILKHKEKELEKIQGRNQNDRSNKYTKTGKQEIEQSSNTIDMDANESAEEHVDASLCSDNDNRHNERIVYGLILLPTRELCMQVVDEIKHFEKDINIKSVAVYGGVPKYTQINNLKKGADIIVATPGRLLDLLENGIIHLLKCIYVVIDEADRLLDMGFEKQLRKIMTQINKNKQLLFLTATWPEQVRKLAYDVSSSDPVKIQIGKSELTANKNIEQNVIVSSSIDLKKKLLDWLKENYEGNKILIFCSTKRNCDNLCKELRYHQYNALSIHSDKQQRERDRILNNYKSDRCNILVATDVASRGLDIKNISVVINYDIPNTIEDYIHRIGRTGRAGRKGKAILFFPYDYYVPQKIRFAKELIKLLNKINHVVPAELREIVGAR